MSLMELLYERFEERPDAEAIVHGEERISFAEMIERIERLASGFAAAGLKAGDSVALLLRNDPWFIYCFHAVTALGAVAVPIDPAFKRAEIAAHFTAAEVRWVLSDERIAGVSEAIAASSERPMQVFTTNEAAGNNMSIRHLHQSGSPGRLPIRDEEPMIFQFSSGSTGRAKRLIRTHANAAAEGRLYQACGFGSEDRVLCAVPLFHNWGLGSCVFTQAVVGSCIVVLPDPHPFLLRRHQALELIERERVTIFPGVPFNYRLMAEAPTDADLSSLRLCFTAGTALPRPIFEAFGQRFGVLIRQLYGTTETGMISANTGPDPVATSASVGEPSQEVAVAIVGEGGEALPPGEEGEVTVGSPAMTDGYVGEGMDEQNRIAFRDGRYFTGDLGRFGEDGLLYLTGRTKLLIEVGGYKVDPIEVEDVILEHPAVAEAIVVGLPGQVQGEELIKAAVVPSAEVDGKELTAFCRERLANFKVPQTFEFRDEIPRSPMGKILRKYLVSD
jgi:long-chain acyl-CoA synthetase